MQEVDISFDDINSTKQIRLVPKADDDDMDNEDDNEDEEENEEEENEEEEEEEKEEEEEEEEEEEGEEEATSSTVGTEEDEEDEDDDYEYFKKLRQQSSRSDDENTRLLLAHNVAFKDYTNEELKLWLHAEKKTVPFLTKYEKTRVVGERVKQLNNGAKPFIDLKLHVGIEVDAFKIAMKELEQKRLPFIIMRPIPDGSFEFWHLNDLEY